MSGKFVKLSMLVSLLVVLLSGCGPTILLKEPVRKENKTWSVEVKKVYDGVGYSQGNTIYYPPAGDRFISTLISVTNKTDKPQEFRLDKVYLVNGDKGAGPAIIDMDAFVAIQAKPNPTLSPKENITRLLIYAYPFELIPESIIVKGVGKYDLPKPKKK